MVALQKAIDVEEEMRNSLDVNQTATRDQVVECNNLASGRAPHELANELQSLFKGTNSRKSKVDKLLARTDWVSRNLSHVLDELGLPPDGRWTVEPHSSLLALLARSVVGDARG